MLKRLIQQVPILFAPTQPADEREALYQAFIQAQQQFVSLEQALANSNQQATDHAQP